LQLALNVDNLEESISFHAKLFNTILMENPWPRYGQAGEKFDPGDAVVLATILRTDRHVPRALPEDSE
jgi:hypothetical protein